MTEKLFEIYLCVQFFIWGYLLGNTTGYGQGLKSARKIWEDSYKSINNILVTSITQAKEKLDGNNNLN